MNKKVLVAFVSTVIAGSAFAQSSKFQGAFGQIGVGYESVNCCQFRSTTKESFSIVNHCSNMG